MSHHIMRNAVLQLCDYIDRVLYYLLACEHFRKLMDPVHICIMYYLRTHRAENLFETADE
jgi:hypothetical protein